MKRKTYTKSKARKTYVDKKTGYRKFKDSGKSVHRWVAEKKIGRELNASEVVHHKNRNKLDNSPQNLRVLPNQKEHYKLHKKAGY
jgi:hypothetical protein